MAKEPRAPWSRWDFTDANILSLTRLRDLNSVSKASHIHTLEPLEVTEVGGLKLLPPLSSSLPATFNGANIVTTRLLAKEYNQFDPSFYNCIYGTSNEIAPFIEQCHVNLDCCEKTCCDSGWHFKYGWALVLLFLFCAAVAVVCILWLVTWLNRQVWSNSRKNTAVSNQYHRYDSHGTHNNGDLKYGLQFSEKNPATIPSATFTLPHKQLPARHSKTIAGSDMRANLHTPSAVKF